MPQALRYKTLATLGRLWHLYHTNILLNRKLFPFGWYHMLKALRAKQMEKFDLLIIAVRPDYQDRGLNAVIIADQHPYFIKYGIKEVETTAILETNTKNQGHWEMFPHKIHKRRRAYIKDI